MNFRLPVVVFAAAIATHAIAADPQVFRFGRFEHTFTSAKDYANPLKEEVIVRFEGPNGFKDEVLAFWDGGRRWKVRFSPEHVGEWRFHTTASDTSDAGLHQQTGRFRVVPYKGKNALYKNGPPRLSANRRYFVQDYNRPWFWLADTAWNGALLSTGGVEAISGQSGCQEIHGRAVCHDTVARGTGG